VKIFFLRLGEIIDTGLKETELRSFYRDSRWQEKSMSPALHKIRALTRGENFYTNESERNLRLLSELTVPLPLLVENLHVSEARDIVVAVALSGRAITT
jgi:hypothetical protein